VGPATIEYRVSTVRERIKYRFRVPSAAVFTLYSYSKTLEYRFRVPTAGSLSVNQLIFLTRWKHQPRLQAEKALHQAADAWTVHLAVKPGAGASRLVKYSLRTSKESHFDSDMVSKHNFNFLFL
jgi:hypothetical protein